MIEWEQMMVKLLHQNEVKVRVSLVHRETEHEWMKIKLVHQTAEHVLVRIKLVHQTTDHV